MKYLLLLSALGLVFSCSSDSSSKPGNNQNNQNNFNNLNNQNNANNLNNANNISGEFPCGDAPCYLRTETVADTFASKQNTASGDSLYVAYEGFQTIEVARKTASGWETNVVATEGTNSESGVQIAADSDGNVTVLWENDGLNIATKNGDNYDIEEAILPNADSYAVAYSDGDPIVAFSNPNETGILFRDADQWRTEPIPNITATAFRLNLDVEVLDGVVSVVTYDLEDVGVTLHRFENDAWNSAILLSDISVRESTRNLSLHIDEQRVLAAIGNDAGLLIGDVTDGTWTPIVETEVLGSNIQVWTEAEKIVVAYIGNQPGFGEFTAGDLRVQQVNGNDCDNGFIGGGVDETGVSWIVHSCNNGITAMTNAGAYPESHYENCDALTAAICELAQTCEAQNDGDICVSSPSVATCFSPFGCPSNTRNDVCGSASRDPQAIVDCLAAIETGSCVPDPNGDPHEEFSVPSECADAYVK